MESMQWLDTLASTALGIGVDPRELSSSQVALRAVFIYLAGMLVIRLGATRFLGRHTVFDIILGFLVGALLSRSVNGSGPLVPTLVAVVVLLGLHWVFARIAISRPNISTLLRGRVRTLVANGEVDEKAMRRHLVTSGDLEEAMRLSGRRKLDQVADACLERNGDISIVPQGHDGRDGGPREAGAGAPPQVVEIQVRDGVQTVRLLLG